MVVCAGQDAGDGAVQQAPHDRLPEVVRSLTRLACFQSLFEASDPAQNSQCTVPTAALRLTAALAVGRYPYSHIEPQPRIYPYEPRKPLGECYICCNISDVCTGGTPGTPGPPHASSLSCDDASDLVTLEMIRLRV